MVPTVAAQQLANMVSKITPIKSKESQSVPALTTPSYFTSMNASTLGNDSSIVTTTHHGHSHYDYQTSFVQWIIICSTVLAIALGFATALHIKKATNWDYRAKMKKIIKQRKIEVIENRRIRRVKNVWQTPEEFLTEYDDHTRQVELLAQKLVKEKSGVGKKWTYEFENIRKRPPAGTTNYTGLKAFELSGKNIIKECIPYDHNRVKLPLDPTVPCSDYINGSMVDSYSSPNFYLAVQGPFEASIIDFWRTVWIYKIRCIVMLCEPFEFAARHCFKYWPEKAMSYDDIEVIPISIHKTLDYTYRIFKVSHVASNDALEVVQFQYRNWPQFGQPDVYTFLNFIYLIRSFNVNMKPVLVHSKTGSDRTGLYIAIDYCMESICRDKKVNIHESVLRIRRSRMGMVATIEQYEFIYQAIRVFLLCGVTDVPVRHLVRFVHVMSAPMNGLETTGFQQQFQHLQTLRRELTQNDSATGIMSENRWVSRDATCLPPDEYRAHLITGRKGCHDYINAVICDDYLRPNSFILTQWPLLTTIKDFWRMIYDYGIVSTIVLSQRYPKFWPVRRGKRQLYDVVSVNLESKDRKIWGTEYTYTMRQWEGFVDMKSVLMKAEESGGAVPKGEGRTHSKWLSKVFVISGWKPDSPQADRSESIVEVLLEMEKWQKEVGPEKFICVVSTDGVKQCGTFMSLYMAHQQMMNDCKVDLLSTALAVRRTRPQLIPTAEEYEYGWRLSAMLYKTLQANDETQIIPTCPETHLKPIPGLCTRCWFCKNRNRIVSSKSRSSTYHPEQPDNQGMVGLSIEEDLFVDNEFSDEENDDDPFVIARRSQQRLAALTIQATNNTLPVPNAELTIIPPPLRSPSREYADTVIDMGQSQLLLKTVEESTEGVRLKAPKLINATKLPAFSQRSDEETTH